jgi:hypothetical protein
MVLNATFNNISVIVWRSVLWCRKPEKTTDKLDHILFYLFCSSIVINTVIVTAGNFEP